MRKGFVRVRAAVGAALMGLIAAGVLGAQARTAQVEGWVRRAEDGGPLPGARVRVVGSGQSAIADAEGAIRLQLPAGEVALVAEAPGRAAVTHRLRLAPGAVVRLTWALPEAALTLDPLVVSATREARARSEIAASVGVVEGRDLRTLRPPHPKDVLNLIPGVWLSTAHGEGHLTAIRQPITTKPVYAYLQDGIPVRSPGFFNHNALYEVNLVQAERLEVVRGPASVVYGSDAIGGAINVSTRPPAARPGAEATLEANSLGWRRMFASATGTWAGHGVRVNVLRTLGDRWRRDGGYGRTALDLRWDRPTRAGLWRLTANAGRIDQKDPSWLAPDRWRADPRANDFPIAYRHAEALRAALIYERERGATVLRAGAFARANRLALLPFWMLSYDPVVTDVGHRSVGMVGYASHDWGWARAFGGLDVDVSPGWHRENRIAVTRDGSRYVAYTVGPRIYDYRVTYVGAAPYAQVEVAPWAWVRLVAAARYDEARFRYRTLLPPVDTGRWRRPANTTVRYRQVSPKLGLVVTPAPGWSLMVQRSRGFRVPSEGQIFRQGPSLPTTALEPVRADNVEVGLRGAWRATVAGELTAYRLRIRDDILTYVRPDRLRETQNAGATVHRGVEAGLTLAPWPWLSGRFAYTRMWQRYERWRPSATVDYSGREVELAPRSLFSGRVEGRWGVGGVVGLQVQRIGAYWEDPDNAHRYPGHTVWALDATVPVRSGVQLLLRLDNVANRRYAERVTFDPFVGEQVVPGAPRSLSLGVHVDTSVR